MNVNISSLIEQINKVENYEWDRVQSDYILNNYGSFLFKTYEYNDRKLVEKHINQDNKKIHPPYQYQSK